MKKNHKVFILAISDSGCEHCCQGELILAQIVNLFKTDKGVAYKGKAIPIVRIDSRKYRGNLQATENLHYDSVPKVYLWANHKFNEYGDQNHIEYFLAFLNRHLYPVVILKTRRDVERFINCTKEWTENTPFYKSRYFPMKDVFTKLRKSTRVVAFIADKDEYRDELKLLTKAALALGIRDDLRIGKITQSDVVKEFKKEHNLKWFSDISSSSLVIFQSNDGKFEEPKFLDISTENRPYVEWINENSIKALEPLTGVAANIIQIMK
jgi:hypothetical protein